jgi:hypothetical protein
VPSAVIRCFSYRAERRELEIEFRSGRRYVYAEVPAEIYEQMQAAFSKGEFFNTRVRDSFEFTRRV